MNIENIKFFVGPMSKNIVDSIIEFTEQTDHREGRLIILEVMSIIGLLKNFLNMLVVEL